MKKFEEELIYEINDRINEISMLKTIPHLHKLSEQQFKLIQKHTIPAIYALWEGFVKKAFTIYSREIDKMRLSADQINPSLLTHSIDLDHTLSNGKSDFDKKSKFVVNICNYINSEIVLTKKIPTNSNVSYKVINNILARFNLNKLSSKQFETRMDRMLHFRNCISHGEHNIQIDQKEIDAISLTVIDLMNEIFERVVQGYKNKGSSDKKMKA